MGRRGGSLRVVRGRFWFLLRIRYRVRIRVFIWIFIGFFVWVFLVFRSSMVMIICFLRWRNIIWEVGDK